MRQFLKTLSATFLGFILAISATVAFAVDWDNPTTTSLYTDVLTALKARDVSLATMNFDSDSNIPDGSIRWNDSTDKFEIYDQSGASWSDLQPALSTHLASTANPHSVTAAQVGAPTSAAFTAHTSDTANPHSVTATQVGALAKSSNLSDVTNATTARSNIGAASSATLTAHTSNTSNPHSVTRIQLGAAASGENSDITGITGINRVTGGAYGLFLRGGVLAGSKIQFETYTASGAETVWEMNGQGELKPVLASKQFDYCPECFAFTTTRSLNPAAATTEQVGNFCVTLSDDLRKLGLLK